MPGGKILDVISAHDQRNGSVAQIEEKIKRTQLSNEVRQKAGTSSALDIRDIGGRVTVVRNISTGCAWNKKRPRRI
jgi:hypothetical protein